MTTFHDLSQVSDLPRHHPYSAAQARAVTESRSALLAAASLPRDERLVRHRLLSLCSDPHFAVFALCCDAPTLTLAETAARLWGNLTFGLRERACEAHICEQEAFACDLETNVQAVRRFRARRAGGEENAFLLAALLDVLPAPLMAEALDRCRAALSEPNASPTDDTTPDPAAGGEAPATCEAAPTSEEPDLCRRNEKAPGEAPIREMAGEAKVDAAPAGSAKKRGRPRRAAADATSALPEAPSEGEARPVAVEAKKEHKSATAKKARRRSAPENETQVCDSKEGSPPLRAGKRKERRGEKRRGRDQRRGCGQQRGEQRTGRRDAGCRPGRSGDFRRRRKGARRKSAGNSPGWRPEKHAGRCCLRLCRRRRREAATGSRGERRSAYAVARAALPPGTHRMPGTRPRRGHAGVPRLPPPRRLPGLRVRTDHRRARLRPASEQRNFEGCREMACAAAFASNARGKPCATIWTGRHHQRRRGLGEMLAQRVQREAIPTASRATSGGSCTAAVRRPATPGDRRKGKGKSARRQSGQRSGEENPA